MYGKWLGSDVARENDLYLATTPTPTVNVLAVEQRRHFIQM